jgi:hypothetical protein
VLRPVGVANCEGCRRLKSWRRPRPRVRLKGSDSRGERLKRVDKERKRGASWEGARGMWMLCNLEKGMCDVG